MKVQDYPAEMNAVVGCFVNGGKRERVCVCVSHTETSAVLSHENTKMWRKRVTIYPLGYLGNSSPPFCQAGRCALIYKYSTGIVSISGRGKGKIRINLTGDRPRSK